MLRNYFEKDGKKDTYGEVHPDASGNAYAPVM
jgi:hypothetical protein